MLRIFFFKQKFFLIIFDHNPSKPPRGKMIVAGEMITTTMNYTPQFLIWPYILKIADNHKSDIFEELFQGEHVFTYQPQSYETKQPITDCIFLFLFLDGNRFGPTHSINYLLQ